MKAVERIVDGRDIITQSSEIFVTLEKVIATILLACRGLELRQAAVMLNEGILPGVEE